MIEEKEMENKQLILIPKVEEYIEYMLNIIVKLPRTEKFSIGSEYKLSMYQMLKSLLYLNEMNRTQRKEESLHVINKIDTDLNCQRIYLRIMKKQKWIDIKKFDIIMQKIYEMGKIIGGLTKFYAKNN